MKRWTQSGRADCVHLAVLSRPEWRVCPPALSSPAPPTQADTSSPHCRPLAGRRWELWGPRASEPAPIGRQARGAAKAAEEGLSQAADTRQPSVCTMLCLQWAGVLAEIGVAWGGRALP